MLSDYVSEGNDEYNIDDLLDCIYKNREYTFLSKSGEHDDDEIKQLLIDVINIIKFKEPKVNQILEADYVAEKFDNPLVLTYVGTKLLLKAGICKNNKLRMQGEKCIEIAAMKGEDNARFILYLLNNGTVKDLLECRSAGTYVELLLYLPQLYSGKEKELLGLKLLNKAISKGSCLAKTVLGIFYIGKTDCYDKGVMLLEEANKCGDVLSNLYLGQVFLLGKGVDKDLEKAFSYFEKYKENAACSYHLGRYYLSGKYVVKQNYELSIEYFTNAIKHGDTESYPYLIYIYSEGPKRISNTKKSKRLFKEFKIKNHISPKCEYINSEYGLLDLIQLVKANIDNLSIVVKI